MVKLGCMILAVDQLKIRLMLYSVSDSSVRGGGV